MRTEEALLAALAADPADHELRLALADWLEENGRVEQGELARLHARQLMKTGTPEELARLCALLDAGVRPVVPEVENSIGMRLALIPPGAFLMGSPQGEAGRQHDDEAQHEVTITRPFYLGVFPVTQAEYRKVTGQSPSRYAPRGDCKDEVKGLDTSRFPVENVRWEEAVAFCAALTEREGGKGTISEAQDYRLPTEAQWERACRAGAASYQARHFGAAPTLTRANYFGGNFPRDDDYRKGLGRPCEVGSYPPNAFGLYDMLGNVWEWCQDKYARDTYETGPFPRVDPTGPRKGRNWDRAFRGSCYRYAAEYLRSAQRGHAPDFWDDAKGFRVCLTPPAERKPAKGRRASSPKE